MSLEVKVKRIGIGRYIVTIKDRNVRVNATDEKTAIAKAGYILGISGARYMEMERGI